MFIQYLLCIIGASPGNKNQSRYALGVKVSYEYVMRNRVAKNNILLITPFFLIGSS